jgi:hypothetical protein
MTSCLQHYDLDVCSTLEAMHFPASCVQQQFRPAPVVHSWCCAVLYFEVLRSTTFIQGLFYLCCVFLIGDTP